MEIGEGETPAPGGLLDAGPSAQLISRASRAVPAALPPSTVQAAIHIKEHRAPVLMADPAIRAVGVGVSADDPDQAALVIYYLQGKAHSPTPNTIDGLRTRLRQTTGFHAGFSKPAQVNGTVQSRGCTASVMPTRANKALR